jgi:hypothetical protein
MADCETNCPASFGVFVQHYRDPIQWHVIILKQSKGGDDFCLLTVFRGNGYLVKSLDNDQVNLGALHVGRGVHKVGQEYLSNTMMVLSQ